MNPFTVLYDSFYFFRRNLRQIAALCLPLVVIEAFLQQVTANLVGPDASPAYGLLVGFLIYPLYTAALILLVDARTRGESPLNRDLLAMALRFWPRFAVLSGISTLLILLGLSMFFIPGLCLTVILAFAEYQLVLRGLAPLQAMRESIQLSRGHFWRTAFCIFAVIVPLWLLKDLSLVLYPEPQFPVMSLLIDSANNFLQLFTTVVLFRLFML